MNLTGGKTRDGGSVVGGSVFYSCSPELEHDGSPASKDDVEKLNQELKVNYAIPFVILVHDLLSC